MLYKRFGIKVLHAYLHTDHSILRNTGNPRLLLMNQGPCHSRKIFISIKIISSLISLMAKMGGLYILLQKKILYVKYLSSTMHAMFFLDFGRVS